MFNIFLCIVDVHTTVNFFLHLNSSFTNSDMLERRPLMSLLIGLTICISLWHIMLQQQQSFEPASPTTLINDSIFPSFPLVVTNETSNVSSDVQKELLPKNDYSQLIDLEDFEFLINHRSCRESNRKPIIVTIIHSAPDNFDKRTVIFLFCSVFSILLHQKFSIILLQIIRETWGSFAEKDSRGSFYFLLGAVNSTNLQQKIYLENNVFGDLVQGNFEDTYRNMTYKHVAALKFFVYNCHNVSFMLKTDDDVFVNMPMIYKYLENPSVNHQHFHKGRLLFCNEVAHAKVKRTFRSKWRVAYFEFLERYYPRHCPGFSIIYSADAVIQLYKEAQKLPYFWVDDVYITGIIATKLNISIASTNSLFLTVDRQNDLISGRIQAENVPFFFAQPNLGEKEIRDLWKLVKNSSANNV